jgi:hypothetical protein
MKLNNPGTQRFRYATHAVVIFGGNTETKLNSSAFCKSSAITGCD